MGFPEALKKLLSLKLPEHLHFSLVTIVKNDNSKKVEYTDSSKKLIINNQRLDPAEKEGFKKVCNLAFEEEGYAFLESDAKVKMDDFREGESSLDTKKILEFLKPKIPQEDVNIWRAALYMRGYFRANNKERTRALKNEIMQKYGDKGRNIANLCSTNYLEDFLIPLYNSLKENHPDEQLAVEKFKKRYINIINELPFIIFVNHNMTKDNIEEQIMRKKKYGFKFLNIHGIGPDNIKNIRKVVEYFENHTEWKIKKEIREENSVIFVKIGFIEG